MTPFHAFSGTDWFFFLVLDIGNPAIDSIPVGVRFIDGLLQAVAVRAAGFATVTLSALAPAVKYVCLFICVRFHSTSNRVLYVIMMYISVCESSHSLMLVMLTPLIWFHRSYSHEVLIQLYLLFLFLTLQPVTVFDRLMYTRRNLWVSIQKRMIQTTKMISHRLEEESPSGVVI